MEEVRAISRSERLDWLRLIRSENVGPITFYQLLGRYGSAARALEALPELARRGGRKKPIRVCSVAAAAREMEQLERFGGRMIAAIEPDYPKPLRQIADPPPILSIVSHGDLLNRDIIAVVGARNASAAAIRLTRQIAGELSTSGLVVASGLARGIDTAAHVASLDGGTVAVVGGGIDYIYPKENEALQAEIAARGCVIAEQPFGTVPQARHFPRRNRLISGLALGVLVAEASPRSGSLITARMALEQGREVFAIPGSPLDPRARGTNGLIRSGATLVESTADILDALESLRRRPMAEPDRPLYPLFMPELPGEAELDAARPEIVDLIGAAPIEIDEIVRLSGLPPSLVLTILLELELAGRIERHFGNRVSIAP